ncbi:hypothetical protein [Halovulum sp. GXIMD14793]
MREPKPPRDQRWHLSSDQMAHARQLFDMYSRDAGLDGDATELIGQTVRPCIAYDHLAELSGLARQLDVPLDAVIVGNAYYDLVKTALACSAFALATPTGPIHARNLDWWTENSLLSTATLATRFTGAPAGEFTSIGWPGFAGVLSGVAPGRFAITLNAVLKRFEFTLRHHIKSKRVHPIGLSLRFGIILCLKFIPKRFK